MTAHTMNRSIESETSAQWTTETIADSVVAFCGQLDERTDELAHASRLPDDLYELAATAGLFRQLVPSDLGGVGSPPVEWFRVGLEIARHDASAAWVITQGAAELGWISAGADPAWSREVLADPSATSASTIAGAGSLALRGDEAQVEGRWGFNTGCHHASWIGGLTIVSGPDGPAEPPEMRFAWVPAERAEILDDWNPSGLRGTGSNSTVIPQQTIPTSWTFSPMVPTDNPRGPYGCVVGNGNWPIAASVAAVQLGSARRVLDELRAMLAERRNLIDGVPLAHDRGVQVELMEAEASWRAARASAERELEEMWAQALQCEQLDVDRRVALKLACVGANLAAVETVNTAIRLTNTATVDPDLALSRCIRDVHALQGHIGVGRASVQLAAQMSLGLAPEHHLV